MAAVEQAQKEAFASLLPPVNRLEDLRKAAR